MPLGTLLHPSDIKLVDYRSATIPKGAVFQAANAVNACSSSPLNASEPVLSSKLSAPTSVEGVSSTIETGYRAVSVQITDVTGVAGLSSRLARGRALHPPRLHGRSHHRHHPAKCEGAFHRPPDTGRSDGGPAHAQVARGHAGAGAGRRPEAGARKNEGKISLSLRNPLDAPSRPPPAPSPPRCSTP